MITPRANLTIVVLSALTTCALAGCVDTYSGAVARTNLQFRPKGAELTLGAVLQLADGFKRGMGLEDFAASEFSYRCKKDEECEWMIIYVGKAHIWHDYTAQASIRPILTVDDRTGYVDVLPGR